MTLEILVKAYQNERLETNKDLQTTKAFLPRPYLGIIGIIALALSFIFHLGFLTWIGILALFFQGFRSFRNLPSNTKANPQATPEALRKQNVQQLKRGLSKAQIETLTEKPATQALEQLQQNQERMTSFERTLSLKLSPTELTYARYHGAAHEVYLAILDQLNDIATRLTNVISIKTHPDSASASAEEITRAELRQSELSKVSQKLQLNESALTRMDQLTHAVSEMKTQSLSSSSELGPLLLELEELAQRAKKY